MNFVLVEDKPAEKATAAIEIAHTPAQPAETGRRIRQIDAAVTAMSAPTRTVQSARGADDRRWATRRRSDMPGYIAHAKNPQGIRCIVRNTSSSGALVEVCAGTDRFANPADEIPDRLTLVFISYRERTEVACAVMRRNGRMLGVRYVGAFRSFPAPQPAMRGVKKR